MDPVPTFRIISLFEDMPESELRHIASMCTVRAYQRHAQILSEHEETNDIFFVFSGNVRIASYTEGGREVIFHDISDGGIFGEFSAIDRLPRSATAVAQTDCLLARMRAAQFHEALVRNNGLAISLIELLVAKMRAMSERVVEVSALAVRERVRRELLRLVTTRGVVVHGGVTISPAPTHYEIASRIGSHREAVTREFSRLEVEKVIETSRRQIRILNIAQLKAEVVGQ
ncbi:Crp/Fnr family transcriptional regulator [Reyranella sp.]|uniref:Crp/Fnr family transcriptional regulator n=1 Tax=Reyranella sp. TaxID=1929291 RepID=UPI00271DB90C|nr:Crp/Fnr family transcriptional regulator [Reyranella sp.]MDO8975809.1 Crp/Fnr family transcriptional regulator [Reyranella sp.]